MCVQFYRCVEYCVEIKSSFIQKIISLLILNCLGNKLPTKKVEFIIPPKCTYF